MRGKARRLKRGDLALKNEAALGIFVAQVEVDRLGLDRPGGDQHPFEKAVRILLKVVAVLESAGLALVAVDRHQPRRRLLADKAPLAPGREPGPAEPAQPRTFKRGDHRLNALGAGQAGFQQGIAAAGAVGVEAGIGGQVRMRLTGRDRGGDAVRAGVLVQRVTDGDDRRLVAAAHARRPHHPHARAEPIRQFAEQPGAAHHRAGQAVADPHRDRRRRRLVIHDDVEMGVERGDLVDLDQRQPHLLGERRKVAGVQAAEAVLQQVQVLDQQVAPPLPVAEQGAHLGERRRIDLAALRVVGTAPPSRAGMDAAVVLCLRRHGRRYTAPSSRIALMASAS